MRIIKRIMQRIMQRMDPLSRTETGLWPLECGPASWYLRGWGDLPGRGCIHWEMEMRKFIPHNVSSLRTFCDTFSWFKIFFIISSANCSWRMKGD